MDTPFYTVAPNGDRMRFDDFMVADEHAHETRGSLYRTSTGEMLYDYELDIAGRNYAVTRQAAEDDLYEDDGQPSEQDEWLDYDPDC